MLDKKISLSEKVASLEPLGQLIYTWMIPHADDFGLLQASPRTVKALVIPMIDSTADEVGFHLETMRKTGLIAEITINGKNYYKIIGSENNQTLKKDRQPQTIMDVALSEDKNRSWIDCQTLVNDALGNQTETIGNQTVPELKGTEEKRINTMASAEAPQIEKPAFKQDEEYLTSGEYAYQNGTKYPISVVKKTEVKPSNGMSSMKDLLANKPKLAVSPAAGIVYEWQEKALRYADDLKLTLGSHARARWMKIFKQAFEGRKTANIEKAYSYIIDYPKDLSNEQKMLFFFKIYENGTEWLNANPLPKKGGE